MPKSASDILRGTGEDAIKLKTLVGQVITIVDFEVKHSKKYDSDFVLIEALNTDDDEVTVMGGEHLVSKLQKLEKNGFLPLPVKVVEFDTDSGTGYGLDPVED